MKDLLKIVGDQYGCPTNAYDLADAILQIIKSKDRFDKESKKFIIFQTLAIHHGLNLQKLY